MLRKLFQIPQQLLEFRPARKLHVIFEKSHFRRLDCRINGASRLCGLLTNRQSQVFGEAPARRQQYARKTDAVMRRLDNAEIGYEVANDCGGEDREAANGERNFPAAEFCYEWVAVAVGSIEYRDFTHTPAARPLVPPGHRRRPLPQAAAPPASQGLAGAHRAGQVPRRPSRRPRLLG